ncbi:hypothetical protein [Heyndrickxia sporothermodurans]
MRLERREAVRWKREAWGYEAGKKRSGPMEKESVRLWYRKEEKRSDGEGKRGAMRLERREVVRWRRNTCVYGAGKKKSGPMEKEHV